VFSLGNPAAFPSPWIKASGFASHPFGWYAFSSFIYPQIIFFYILSVSVCVGPWLIFDLSADLSAIFVEDYTD